MSLPANITHLLFIDFEATCKPKGEYINPREIIEFPVFLVRVRDSFGNKMWSEVDKFHEFVRPVHYPELSRCCIDLTGISQSQVASADTFPVVFARFTAWLRKHGLKPESSLFVVDNSWDVGDILARQMRISSVSAPIGTVPFDKWLNVKRAFLRRKLGGFGMGDQRGTYINNMLSDLGLEVGKLRGVENARGLMRIYKKLDELGCTTFEAAIGQF